MAIAKRNVIMALNESVKTYTIFVTKLTHETQNGEIGNGLSSNSNSNHNKTYRKSRLVKSFTCLFICTVAKDFIFQYDEILSFPYK